MWYAKLSLLPGISAACLGAVCRVLEAVDSLAVLASSACFVCAFCFEVTGEVAFCGEVARWLAWRSRVVFSVQEALCLVVPALLDYNCVCRRYTGGHAVVLWVVGCGFLV